MFTLFIKYINYLVVCRNREKLSLSYDRIIIISLWQWKTFLPAALCLSVLLNCSFSYPPLFLSLFYRSVIVVLVFHFCFLCFVFLANFILYLYSCTCTVMRWFLSVLLGSSCPVLPCLRCVGTAGSQSECSQSGAGGQHPAGERCSEDKPSCSRTGNKPRATSSTVFHGQTLLP